MMKNDWFITSDGFMAILQFSIGGFERHSGGKRKNIDKESFQEKSSPCTSILIGYPCHASLSISMGRVRTIFPNLENHDFSPSMGTRPLLTMMPKTLIFHSAH